MAKSGAVGLNELFQLFEDHVTMADIVSSRYLGKISAAIVKRRIELKMTQKEFADYVDVSQGMVSRWEGGDYNFTIKNLAELAEKLELDLYINLKKHRDNTATSYEQSEFTCVASEKKQFTTRQGNVIDFRTKSSSMHRENDGIIKLCNYIKRMEM